MTEMTVTAPTRLSAVPKPWQTVCCYESGVLDRGVAPDVRARAPNLPGALTNKDWSRAKPRFQSVVQEAWLDWHRCCSFKRGLLREGEGIRNPVSYVPNREPEIAAVGAKRCAPAIPSVSARTGGNGHDSCAAPTPMSRSATETAN
jgi:hypothetical protein